MELIASSEAKKSLRAT